MTPMNICSTCGEVLHPDTSACAACAAANEHQRLADAASRLIDSIDPLFVGDLPQALNALAEVCEEKGWAYERGAVGYDLVKALRAVSRSRP